MFHRTRLVLAMALLCALAILPAAGRAFATSGAPPATEGRLVTRAGGETVDVPLEHTDVQIRVAGHLADVTMTQFFRNPYRDKIEAVYLFPLPTGAAVYRLDLRVGERAIRGAIHRRAAAERIYERAREGGHVAALLTQERPNLFTQAVANIEPGARIAVSLRYSQTLHYEDGAYELVFPMVAGPRHVPGSGPDAAAVRDAVQPAVLPPGMRPATDIMLYVEIDAGVPVRDLASPSHRIESRHTGAHAIARIAASDVIPNRDFVLRWAVAGPAPTFAVLAHRDRAQGSFFLLAQPPAAAVAEAAPREIVFVLDTSSSMAGAPLAKAKELIRRVLAGLRPDDTYQIVRFADTASALGPAPIASKPANVRHTLDWLDALPAAGGTEMVTGIRAALDVPHDPARLRITVFLTDGYIGNEDEILAMVGEHMGEARLFSFGVGSAVNRYLLEEMAAMGRGAVQFVRPDEDTAAAVQRFHDRIDAPVLTDLRIDWKGLPVADVVPARIPDLFAGQPLVLAGHYDQPGRAVVTVHGRQAGRAVSFDVPVDLPLHAHERPDIARVWARARLAELERALVRRHDPAIEEQMVALALGHQLVSRYTAFVAVDESSVTAGGPARKVKVAVEVPAHVRGVGAGTGGGWGAVGMGYYGTLGHASGFASSGYGVGVVVGVTRAGTAPEVRIGAVVVTGSLDTAIIRRYLRRQLAKVRYCYEKALVMEPELAGKVVAEFLITPDGATTSVVVTGVGDGPLHACVASVIEGLEFPAVPGSGNVHVRYPFDLRPSAPPAPAALPARLGDPAVADDPAAADAAADIADIAGVAPEGDTP